jgi:hypothetical protein
MKVDEACIKEALRDHNKKYDASQSIDWNVTQLVEVIRATVPQTRRIKCDWCGGVSDSKVYACPFCGSTDDQPIPAKKEHNSICVEEKPVKQVTMSIVEVPAETGIVKYSETDLDAEIWKVNELKSSVCSSMWHLGKQLAHIYDCHIWKARSEDGKKKYKGFADFCKNELKMSDTNVYRLIDVAKNFDEQTVKKFGDTKLGLILQAPAQSREVLLTKLEDEQLSSKQLRDEIKVEKGKAAERGEVTRRDTGRNPNGGGAPPTKPKQVTLVQLEGKHSVPLFAKAFVDDGGKLERACGLEDEPVGFIDMTNEVRQTFEVTTDENGHLILLVDTKRQ